MYCLKCKKNGSIFDKYCKDCGGKLEHKKMDKKFKRKICVSSIVVVILTLICFLGYNLFNYFISPDYTALNYFKAIINNDIDKIYSYLDAEDSTFVSKKILSEKINFFESVNNYKITHMTEYQNYIMVEISYSTNNSAEKAYIELAKTNNYLKPYKVVSGKIANNITFKVPTGSKVIIDDIELTNSKTKDNFDLYHFNHMIKGSYKVKIEINDIALEEEIDVEDNGTYTISNIKLNSELEEKIINKTREELNYIYSSILDNKTFGEIKNRFVSETSELKSSYNSIKRTINSSITNVEFIDFEVKKVTYSSSGKLAITYLVDQNITMNEKTNSYSNYITVEYDYINNAYELYDVSR